MPAAALVVLLLVVVAGCGRNGAAPGASGGTGAPPGESVTMHFAPEPEPPEAGAPVTWSLEVRNTGDEDVTLTFSSGKSGDVVLRREGEEAYRWSEGRFFTEAVRHERVGAGAEVVYRLDEPELDVKPGSYEVVATLAAEPAPEPVRRTLEVVGP